MLDMYTIKQFMNGMIDEEKFKKRVEKTFITLNEEIKTYGSNVKKGTSKLEVKAEDYISSALEDLQAICVIEKEEEENFKKLPKGAAICDMCNNLAHASFLIKNNNKKRTSALFSHKTYMIERIIEECEKQENKCYGKAYDLQKNRETFLVDIPMYGQVSWHLRKRKLNCKEYDFEKDNTVYRNCDLLNRKIKSSDIDYLPTHTRKVMLAMDNEELSESLYGEKNSQKDKNLEEPMKY